MVPYMDSLACAASFTERDLEGAAAWRVEGCQEEASAVIIAAALTLA